MYDLKLTIVQSGLAWENPAQNRKHFETLLETIDTDTDLIVLPEMFSTGFSMNASQLAEKSDGKTASWLQTMASKKKADIVTSIIIAENGNFYNRLFWVKPDGRVFNYDKHHLFRMAAEHKVYKAGRKSLVVNLKGWNIKPFVCYDLRFPVWTRNRNQEYDLALFIANWPQRRSSHWITLLQARAIENQAYVAGVNRIGKDGMGIEYSGDSLIADPLGNLLCHKRGGHQAVHTERLSYKMLENYRVKFPVWMDGDDFEIADGEED